ncbi:bifunctional Zinc finger [Babesia duncani]|uniref:Bifunctional Zinc finger n=1 Tax=Babesia duncani TaxID=323732 RepID=A0AAD9PJ04_9APIC|nr:bifunctional Zinc finger [Babesia duncani]
MRQNNPVNSVSNNNQSNGREFSFEDYFNSKFEELAFDRRGACIVCRKATAAAIRFSSKNVHCHKTCLNLLLFYEFMNHADINWFGNDKNGGAKSQISFSLDQILDMGILTKYGQIERNKCSACGMRHAYFKCAVEFCPNYLHEHCTDNGVVVIQTDDGKNKRPNYRFLLCTQHTQEDEINLIKCRFLSKLSLTKEYNENNIIYKSKIEADIKPVAATAKASKNQRNVVSSQNQDPKYGKQWTSYSGRTICPPKRLECFNAPPKSVKKTGANNNQILVACGKNNQRVHQINTLMVEYGNLRKHKSSKKIEWWHYDILFAPITPDIFKERSQTATNKWDAELYEDICNTFDTRWFANKYFDLKRIFLPYEYTARNIAKAVILHLNPSSLLSDTGSATDLNYDNNGYYNNGEASLMSYGMDVGSLEIRNFGACRPRFFLTYLGNRAAWFSCLLLNCNNSKKIVMLEYMSLTLLEYQYIRRVLRSAIVTNTIAPKCIPILINDYKSNSSSNRHHGGNINLCGFTWEFEPPLYKVYLKSMNCNDKEAKDAWSSDYNTKRVNDIEFYNYDNLIKGTRDIYEAIGNNSKSFVAKQSIALLLALSSVNKALESHKEKLINNMKYECFSQNRRHVDDVMVEQYKDSLEFINQWSSFRKAFLQSIEKFNKAMRTALYPDDSKDEQSQTVDVNATKEYCSVCLQSEFTHKHMLYQCGRCLIRVHERCYGSCAPILDGTKTQNTGGASNNNKQDDGNFQWFCEPCQYESNLSPKVTLNCNTAICCVCCSSGGSMKRVATSAVLAKKGMTSSSLWIHLHCAVFLMPNVKCNDLRNLSMWDLRALRFGSHDRCDICGVIGGIVLKCAEQSCRTKFHPTCAWVAGVYVEPSPLHNSGLRMSLMKPEGEFKDLFTAICLRIFCRNHSIAKFNEEIINAQQKQRCTAYIDYQRGVGVADKQKGKSASHENGKNIVYSPVAITMRGAVMVPLPKAQNPVKAVPEYAPRQERPKMEPIPKPQHLPPPPWMRPREMMPHPMPIPKTSIHSHYGMQLPLIMDIPRYGIHAITNYLSQQHQMAAHHMNGTQHGEDPTIMMHNHYKVPMMVKSHPMPMANYMMYPNPHVLQQHRLHHAQMCPPQQAWNPRCVNVPLKHVNSMTSENPGMVVPSYTMEKPPTKHKSFMYSHPQQIV